MFQRLLLLGSVAPLLTAQGLEWVKANYTKYEYRIAMRDGKKLFTSVYEPKDQSQKYPILLMRTPYNVGPYGPDRYKADIGPSALAAREGYIIVYQDVRGRYLSEGEHTNMTPHRAVKRGAMEVDESTDTYDTIDWLVKNLPNNNGRVGTWGISYPGFYVAAGMIDAHPAHKAASPQAPIVDWFTGDDFHRNGAFYLPHAFNFFAAFGRPRPEPTEKQQPAFDYGMPDGYRFYLKMGTLANANEKHFKNDVAFWNEMMKHDTYDEFWKARNLRPHLKAIKPAVLTVGGWFDAENIYGALQVFETVEKTTPAERNFLVMGPWRHGGWSGTDTGESLGDVRFHSKTSEFYREHIELPFFNFYLKDKGELKQPKAWVFETGTNLWRKKDQWPPRETRPRELYLDAKGKLSFTKPQEDGFDEYVSDPAKPVPYTWATSTSMTREYMTDDQRFASTRPDVLVYESEALEEDVTIAGPLRPSLFVSTTGTDSDWIVKLIDVYPDNYDQPALSPPPPPAGPLQFGQTAPPVDPHLTRMGGYQQLLRGEVFRGKFRTGFDRPTPFEPGKVAAVEYRMNDVYHTFRRGHRIMVQIQSTWFPLVDRNPQKFMNIGDAKETDFQKATERVYRGGRNASSLKVGVVQ